MHYREYLNRLKIAPAGKQSRLKGRVRVLPELDLGLYRISATVDKIVLQVDLKHGKDHGPGTNFRSVQSVLEKAVGKRLFIQATTQDLEAQRSWLQYQIGFQDPKLRVLDCALEALKSTFGLGEPPRVVEMEIALDVRPKGPDIHLKAHRLAALDLLRRHFLPPERYGKQIQPRIYDPHRKETVRVKEMLGGTWRVPPESTMYFGDKENPASKIYKNDPVFWKIYHKECDQVLRKDGEVEAFIPLPEHQKSARIEATFTQEGLVRELGVRTLEDLRDFGFQKVKPFFPFVLPTAMDWREAKLAIMKPIYEHLALETFKRGYEAHGVWFVRDCERRRDRTYQRNWAYRKKEMRRLGLEKPAFHRRPLLLWVNSRGAMVSYKELDSRVSEALRDLKRKFAG